MLSPADVRVLDLNSAWHGVPPSRLMQNAGDAVVRETLRRFRPARVHVLCGPGNNGGDGAVAARRLAEAGASVVVTYARPPEHLATPEARLARIGLDGTDVQVGVFSTPDDLRQRLRQADVVIDALLGVGVAGDLRDPIRAMVKAANASRRPTLSVDVPTGLGGRLQIRPDTTVTFHARKHGMSAAACGRIVVADIGIPPAALDVGPGDLAVHFPRNPAQSHKGQNGRLLVVAGGPYCGAPILSALAALRTGTDLVHLYAPEECAEAAMAQSPDLVVHPGADDRRIVPRDVPNVDALLPKVDAVLMGPGLGTHRDTQAAIAEILSLTRTRKRAVVLDAEAHTVAGRAPQLLRGRPALAAPHAGEYRELTGRPLPADDRRRPAAIAAAALRLRTTLLVKGPVDVVSDGRTIRSNRVHHPWMTVGGTGDVLAGLCGGLMAKGMTPLRAGCAAAFLCGAAGLNAFEEKGWASRATDLLQHIPRVLREWVD